MINYTGTDIYLVSAFKVFHYINSSYMNFECVPRKRHFAFKPGKWTGLVDSCTSVSAVMYHVSEKQEALPHINSFTHLDLATPRQTPSDYQSTGRHQCPLAEYLGSVKPTEEVDRKRNKALNHSKSQHNYLLIGQEATHSMTSQLSALGEGR